MNVGQRIRFLRKDLLKKTLDQFGTTIGLGKGAVSAMETGQRGITDQTILSICREFNVNEQWLRTGEGEMFLQSDPDEEYKKAAEKLSDDEFIRSILVQYFKLSPEHRKLLRDFAYSITENEEKQDDSAAEIDARVQAYREQLEREAAEKESSGSPDAESIA